jgi:glyoxylase-like metal-dependent hydrolase (beta-lactamase superfamily II)
MYSYKVFRSLYLNQNTTLFYGEDGAVVVDPGVFPREMEEIEKFLKENNISLKAILFTHTHGDHFSGWNYLPPAPLHAGSGIKQKNDERKERDLLFIRKIFRSNKITSQRPILFPQNVQTLENGESLRVAGFDFFFYHVPGHAVDQTVIAVPQVKAACTGDMLIRSPYPFILESVFQYRFSLSYMEKIFREEKTEVVIPGHFSEAKGADIYSRLEKEEKYIDNIWKCLLDIYRPDISHKELEERLLKIDEKKSEAHFTHKMNIHGILAEMDKVLFLK